MAETTPTPTTPPAAAKPKRATPGDTSRQTLANLTLAEDVAAAAQDADHKDKLVEEELPATAGAALVTLAKAARDLVSQIVTAKKATQAATKVEEAAHETLMTCLRDVQQRAKGKFPTGDPKRAAYCINKENFGGDREGLEQDAKNIIDLGEADELRALTPAKITAARNALAAWKEADKKQGKAFEDQGKLLEQLKAKEAEVNAKRREIQAAADTAWPHTDKANAPIRRAFKLQPDKPIAQ